MKKEYLLKIILLLIFIITTLSCKEKYINNEIIETEKIFEKETTELYNLFINELYTEADLSEEHIIKNKPYKIKLWPFHILILENEKCYDGEEWHEVMIHFGGGIIIFGEKTTILSETYNYLAGAPSNLSIIDENNNLITNGEFIMKNTKIKIIKDKVEIQFYNSNNELVKQLFEIEDLL